METAKVELKQYITNGFVRSGISYLGYGVVLGAMTGGLGYGAYLLHQDYQAQSINLMSRLGQYLLLAIIGILVLLTLSLFVKGIKYFKRFAMFMKSSEVKLEGHESLDETVIGIALDYLADEAIIYENRNLVLTENHVIVLEGEPCIQPRRYLRSASQDIRGDQAKLSQLKTVVLIFKNQQVKKVNCHYLQEAKDILEILKKEGVKVS